MEIVIIYIIFEVLICYRRVFLQSNIFLSFKVMF